jgi:hypothetical protein
MITRPAHLLVIATQQEKKTLKHPLLFRLMLLKIK